MTLYPGDYRDAISTFNTYAMPLHSPTQTAYPGDVIGINNPGHFAIGDTIFTGSTKVRFPGIPSFSPECFAYMRNPNPSKYKNYRKGLDQVRTFNWDPATAVRTGFRTTVRKFAAYKCVGARHHPRIRLLQDVREHTRSYQ